MKNLKSHFAFNRSQRNGIFILVLLIILMQLAFFFMDFSSEEVFSSKQRERMAVFQRKMDSLKRNVAKAGSVKIFPFNPNFITDYKAYTLGMSLQEIDKLKAYREQDQWINSISDFQKVTGVSDSLLAEISPLFKFPEWVVASRAKTTSEAKKIDVPVPKQDLNKANAEALKSIYGVGDVLSERIVKYRESIGGFTHESQLYDVYGLEPEVVERIIQKFKLENAKLIEKQDLNSISVLALSEIPYFDYELAREVVNYRKLREGIGSFQELANINDFPIEKIERIKLYLTLE